MTCAFDGPLHQAARGHDARTLDGARATRHEDARIVGIATPPLLAAASPARVGRHDGPTAASGLLRIDPHSGAMHRPAGCLDRADAAIEPFVSLVVAQPNRGTKPALTAQRRLRALGFSVLVVTPGGGEGGQ
jgi:hypothetical protein